MLPESKLTIPGYKSLYAFAKETGQGASTVHQHMRRGYCFLRPSDGRRAHPLYDIWRNMCARCHQSDYPSYTRYGGRGITVYLPWRVDFWVFVAYIDTLGPKADKTYTLDRINTFVGYEPGNLRWASKTEQAQNTRLSRTNTSGFKGLHFETISKRWRVRIERCGAMIVDQKFKTKLEALTVLINTRRRLKHQTSGD